MDTTYDAHALGWCRQGHDTCPPPSPPQCQRKPLPATGSTALQQHASSTVTSSITLPIIWQGPVAPLASILSVTMIGGKIITAQCTLHLQKHRASDSHSWQQKLK